jgi:hypothetical protein
MPSAPVNATATGNNTIVAGVAGMKVRVLHYTLIASAAVTVTWQTSSGGALSGGMALAGPGQGLSSAFADQEIRAGLIETAVGDALILNLSGAVAVGGHLTYALVAPGAAD